MWLVAVSMSVISGGAGTVAAVEDYYKSELCQRLVVSRQIEGPGTGVDDGGVVERVAGYYESDGPKAQWYGRQAEEFGIAGELPQRAQIRALAEGQQPRTSAEIVAAETDGRRVPAGVQLGRVFTAGADNPKGRGSARLIEATFDVDKSVSVLWQSAVLSGDTKMAATIEDVLVDSVKAVVDGWEDRATTRLTSDGVTRQVPVEGLTVAIIPELTSRAHDPQLHVHTLTQTKVRDVELGRWRALVADEVMTERFATTVKFHRIFEAGLTEALGVDWEDNSTSFSRRIAGVPQQVCDVFSKRTLGGFEDFPGMKTTLAGLVAEHRREFGIGADVDLDDITMRNLTRVAAIESRPDKAELTRNELVATWADQYRTNADLEFSPDQIVSAAVGRQLQPTQRLRRADLDKAMNGALYDLIDSASGASSFTRADLVVAFTKHLPTDLGIAGPKLAEIIDSEVAAQIGSPSTVDLTLNPGVTPALRRYSTTAVISQEARILDWADTAIEAAGKRAEIRLSQQVAERLGADRLDPEQQAGAALIGGTHRLAGITGPAGAGKTTMARTAVHVLHEQGRQIIGLAPSAAAAQVLAEETGMQTTCTVHKLLFEHFDRDNGPSPDFKITRGATFLVDEGSMVDQNSWDRLTQLADRTGARIVVMGDPEQFGAVGRGGMFTHWVDTLPSSHIVTLDQVHRFHSDWEKAASLAVRDGDTTALDTYLEHGRIVGEATLEEAVDTAAYGYVLGTESGEDVGLFATTNKQVRALNTRVQELRHSDSADPYTLDAPGVKLRNTQRAHVGDRIVTRRNQPRLTTNEGRSIANGHAWNIEKILRNGDLRVSGDYGRIVLPGDYVKEHVDLGLSLIHI